MLELDDEIKETEYLVIICFHMINLKGFPGDKQIEMMYEMFRR